MKTYRVFLDEREYLVYDDSLIAEMANLGKKTTQLPVIIYVSDKRGVNHGPRIKCNSEYGNSWSGESFTVTIDEKPRVIGKSSKIKESDLNLIKDWVSLNYTVLIKYWNMKIDIAELVDELKQV